MNTADRLDRLERRLAALEAAAEPSVPAVVHREGDDTFWALDGLTARVGDHSAVVWAGRHETAEGPVEWQYAVPSDPLTELDDAGLQVVADRLAALGHPARLAILGAVLRGHHRVSELAEVLDLGTSGQVYHHVKALTAAGWLRPAGRGQVTVPAEQVIGLLVAMGVSS